MPTRTSRARWTLILATAGLVVGGLTGCKEEGRAPVLESVDDAMAAVGEELAINLRATDPDGDQLDFGFDAEVDDIDDHAAISVRPDGTAVFRWTPLGNDVGEWPFDFTVSDGSNSDVATATISVRSAADGTAPLFREPVGSGTTLDLGFSACLEVEVVVEDQDDAAVTIGDEEPRIAGAELFQDTGLSGRWSWCPSKEQIEIDRYPLVLSADDSEHEKVLKNFLIVLRVPPRDDCPGKGPAIVHDARHLETVLDVEITAEITDDLGLKNAPLLYYSFEEPKLPIDFSSLEVAEMELLSGDLERGVWTGKIPNPVADAAAGTSADVFYIISATDDDDAEGTCDHVTDAPEEGSYGITVTNPGGEGGAGPCERCSADVQCGAAEDVCAVVGAASEQFCLSACGGEGGCDDGFECASVVSVEGLEAMQCQPVTGECVDVPPMCEDDDAEDNDSRQQAAGNSPTAPDVYEGLIACPGDEDWYRVNMGAEGILGALTDGGDSSNLQLGLYDTMGNEIVLESGAGSDEVIEECLPSGNYYVRVFSPDDARNTYDLLLETTPQACEMTCQDDGLEPDDTTGQATFVDLGAGAFTVNDRMLCSGDDDFYEVELDDNETLVVDLTFVHSNSGDLDTHFFDASGTDLTPCSEAMPEACSIENGQSASSNEHFEWTVDDASCPCTFYVAVVGYAASENGYDLTIDTQ